MNTVVICIVIIIITLVIVAGIAAYVIYKNKIKDSKSTKTPAKPAKKAASKTSQPKVNPKPSAQVNDTGAAPAAEEIPEPGSLRVGSSGIDDKTPSRTCTEEFLPGQGAFKSTIPDPV